MIKTKQYSRVLMYAIPFLSISTTILPSNNDTNNQIQRSHTVLNIKTNTNHHQPSPQQSNHVTHQSEIDNQHEKKLQSQVNKEFLVENKELKQQVEKLTRTKDDLQEDLDNKKLEIDDLNQQIKRIQQQFNEMERDNNDIQEENERIREENDELAHQVDHLTEVVDLYNNNNNALESHGDKELFEQTNQLQKQLSTTNDFIDLSIGMNETNRQNSTTEMLTLSSNNELEILKNEKQTLIQTNNDLTKKYIVLHNKNDDLINNYNTLSQEMENLTNNHKNLKTMYKNLQNEYNRLKQSYEEEQKTTKSNNHTSKQRQLQTQKTIVRNAHFRDDTRMQGDNIKDNESEGNDFRYNMRKQRTQSVGSYHSSTANLEFFNENELENNYIYESSMHSNNKPFNPSSSTNVILSQDNTISPLHKSTRSSIDLDDNNNLLNHSITTEKPYQLVEKGIQTGLPKRLSIDSTPPLPNKSAKIKLEIDNSFIDNSIIPRKKLKKKPPVLKHGNALKIGLAVTMVHSIITTGLLIARTKKVPAKKETSGTFDKRPIDS